MVCGEQPRGNDANDRIEQWMGGWKAGEEGRMEVQRKRGVNTKRERHDKPASDVIWRLQNGQHNDMSVEAK